jgi:hypothetical protein
LSGIDLINKDKKLEVELIYGNAGYLYCLLLLAKHFPEKVDLLKESIRIVFLDLVKNGLVKEKGFLWFEFFTYPYVGTAHGTTGILYLMLKSLKYLSDIEAD